MEPRSPIAITDIRRVELRPAREVGALEPAWDPGGSMSFAAGGGAYTEIQTDAGICGLGPAATQQVVDAARARLLGEDPFEIEKHAATLRYYASGPAYQGAAGIDIALWDVIGKACGQPLYKLWGGSRDRVPAYASMVLLSTPRERADLATRLADEGWRAIKLRLHHATMREDIDTVEQVHRAVGDSMEIMVDANQAQSSGTWQPGVLWDYRRALETARQLDRLGCYWLEEPLPRYAFADLARINGEVGLPLAGGENNPGLHEFAQMLELGVYDILQPESMVCNGITMLRKIGTMAQTQGRRVTPHHGGRGLGTVAHLHLVASWSHAPYLELLHDPPIGDYRHGFSALTNPLVVGDDGCVAVPQGPGLGVEIDPGQIQG